MSGLLPPWPLFSAFLVASLVLAVTPGPGVLYIVTRAATQGRRSGLVSAAAVALGNLCNATAATLGLAALFALSSIAFALVKYAGALYLIYIGMRMMASPGGEGGAAKIHASRRVFRDGFLVALLNPKTTLFYAAFLPQFLTPGPQPMGPAMALGAIFVAIAWATDSLYALASGALSSRLGGGARRIGRRLGGGIFVGLGLFTAISGTRTTS